MNKSISSGHEEDKLEDNEEDLGDLIVSYDETGTKTFKIESSDYVDVLKEGDKVSVLILKDGHKGTCPCVNCNNGLKCEASYSRAEDLKRHLCSTHYFKLDDNLVVRFTSKSLEQQLKELRTGLRGRELRNFSHLVWY